MGDSFTFGQGVHAGDTFCDILEEHLDQRPPNQAFQDYEVFNLGRSGYTVHEERLVFEENADAIDPQLLLLVMCVNDARVDSSPAVDPNLPPHPPIPDLGVCLGEIDTLAECCQRRNIGFAIVFFRVTPKLGFTSTFLERLDKHAREHDLVYLELGDILLGQSEGSQLMVHETDGHPNELAHRRAAESMFDLLIESKLIR